MADLSYMPRIHNVKGNKMNWTIKDLMAETKEPLRRGYWKMTVVSILMILLSVGLSYSSLIDSINQVPALISDVITNEFMAGRQFDGRMMAVLLTMIGGVMFLSVLIKLFLDVFLENPLEVGADKMFLASLDKEKPIMLSDLAFAYDADYLNAVKVLFLKRFFRDMWMLLLVVPGVIKGYEYQMIPYLLSENPYMSHKEAFATSKAMMKGNKKRAFFLDLYFIPWHILGMITLGIAEIFYVAPKKNAVKACFYLKIKEQYEGVRE